MSWYGLSYLAGFVALTGLLYLKGRSLLLALYDGSYLSLSTIVGGRLGYVLCYEPRFYAQHPAEILALYHGGMSFHGALLGIGLGAFLLSRATARLGGRPVSAWYLLDQATWVALIMLPLGRICNFLNGEIYGTVSNPANPFALMYLEPSGLTYRHPVVLYEAAALALLIAPILCYQAWRYRPRSGVTTCSFALLYGIMRFVLEFWREPDRSVGTIAGLNLGQWLCLGQALLAAALLAYLRRQQQAPLLRGTTASGPK